MTKKTIYSKPAQEWLKRAKTDLEDATILAFSRGSPGTAAFLAQQSVEKALKAILAANLQKPPKIHDLVFMVKRASRYEKRLKNANLESLRKMTAYYIEARYPLAWEVQISRKEAKEAIKEAEKILEIASLSPATSCEKA